MNVIFLSGGIEWDTLTRYIGPYKVAHWLRKHGHSAQVIDFVDQWSSQQLYNVVKKFITSETLCLAISTTFMSTNKYAWSGGRHAAVPESLVIVLKTIKEEFPNIKVIMGGYMSDKLTGWGVVDVSMMSYTAASEDIVLEYVEHLKGRGPQPLGWFVTPKVGKKRIQRMHYDRARNPRYNIETDDFRFSKQDCILPGEPLPLDVSRGCIFACRFCQYPHLGKKKLDYVRGMDYIEAELNYNYENFTTTGYYVLDDTFNDTEWKMQEWHKMSSRLSFDLSYSAYIRADLVHRFPDTAHMMLESGLWGAFHGIETLHPEASKIIGKAWSGKHAREYIPTLYHDVWQGKVAQHLSMIVGITHDTQENVDDTVRWYLDNQLHSIRFHPLGLFGKDEDESHRTIQSEFDMNAEKYGFTIYSDDSGKFKRWYNDNWTSESAKVSAERAVEQTRYHKKYSAWEAQTMLWYGFDKEYLMTTLRKDIARSYVLERTRNLYLKYYNMLMAI